MTGFLIRRLGASLLVLFLVVSFTFFLVHLAPGDPTNLLIDPELSPHRQEALRRLYGLDQPLVQQYVDWLAAILIERNWGYSFHHNRPVVALIGDHLPQTLLLAVAAMTIQYGLGFLLGVWAARRADSWKDHLIRIAVLSLYSLPLFWLGLMAILLLSYVWPLFPSGHTHSVGAQDLPSFWRLIDLLYHLALPALVLGAASAGAVARFVRNNLLEVMDQDYLRTARATGLAEGRLLWLYALRNAVVPVIQMLGLSLPFLLSGSLVIETVFSWPGLGRLTYLAIGTRDYPVIIATTALTGSLVVVGTLMADLMHAAVDPRVRT